MGLTFNTAANRSVNTGTDFRTGVQGNMWYKEFEFNTVADSSPNYTTGGIDIGADPINNSKFGLARVDHCDIETKGGFVLYPLLHSWTCFSPYFLAVSILSKPCNAP